MNLDKLMRILANYSIATYAISIYELGMAIQCIRLNPRNIYKCSLITIVLVVLIILTYYNDKKRIENEETK